MEQPIELRVHCKVPQALRQDGGVDLSRLIPALGLKELYARTPTRKFPLYLDSLFSESAVFHLHLPPGLQAGSLPAGLSVDNEFGDYSMRLTSTGSGISIERDFHIPAQVIPPPRPP